MRKFLMTTALTLVLFSGLATAGPVRDFDGSFANVYSAYRTALFTTNSGNIEKSIQAMDAFNQEWSAFSAAYSASPPPQYEDDALWPEFISKIEMFLEEAAKGIAEKQLPAAHEALEGIRDEVGALHERNGIEKYSDKMNSYHAEMENVLGMDIAEYDENTRNMFLERAAVLRYLAEDILRQVPMGVKAEDSEYISLASAFEASVAKFSTAARSGEIEALKEAIGGLKMPYSKFFLKYG